MKDTAGRPVCGADVVLSHDDEPHAWGRTGLEGDLLISPGDAAGELTVSAPGRGTKTIAIVPDGAGQLTVELPEPGAIVATIADEQGQAIACKVQFIGRGGTKTPDFGPDSGEHAVKNVYYSHDGRFRVELAQQLGGRSGRSSGDGGAACHRLGRAQPEALEVRARHHRQVRAAIPVAQLLV